MPSPHVTSRGIVSPPHAPGHLTRLPKRHRNAHKAEEHALRTVAGQQPHPRLSAEPFVDAELLSIRGHHDGIRDVMHLGRRDSSFHPRSAWTSQRRIHAPGFPLAPQVAPTLWHETEKFALFL